MRCPHLGPMASVSGSVDNLSCRTNRASLEHAIMASHQPVITVSTLTCPRCGHQSLEAMPDDACHFFFGCPLCGSVLKPKPGDCCVYCSYGSVPCPPIQRERASTS